MPKKLAYEEVKNYIASYGYVLNDQIYTNDHTKLSITCPLNHDFYIILNSFKNGRRCPICKGQEASKRQRTTYETLLKKVAKLNRKLITTKEEYEQNYIKDNKFLIVECICGNPHKTTLDRIKKKCLCKKCSNKKTGDRSRNSIESVLDLIKSKNYTFISGVYVNYGSLIEVICDKKHFFKTRFSSINKKNAGCPVCKGDKNSERSRMPYDLLAEKALKNNLKILMPIEEYNKNFGNQIKKVLFKCIKCNYEFNSSAARISLGSGCHHCGIKRSSEKRRKPYEEIVSIVKNAGYELITKEYARISQKIDVKCAKHGIFSIQLNDLSGGHGCRKCCHNYSKAQGNLFDFINKFYPDAIENTRKVIPPLELDIYIPSLNLAIEYCGIYWHSEKYKNKNDHYNKMKLCNEKGIRLITIFEDEWLERQDQVKNFLLSAINKNEIRLMARKTELKEVSKQEAVSFLENTHIQGAPIFEVAFGLHYNNELQAVITGNKHHRQGHQNLFVLNRLTFKSNVSISGGASKLLKALINYARSNNYSKLISWSDNRWSQGNVYEKLEFTLTEELPPDYSYVKKQTRISKQSCQKKTLLKKGAVGNTESEMALSLGLQRIWDCGKKRWEITL